MLEFKIPKLPVIVRGSSIPDENLSNKPLYHKAKFTQREIYSQDFSSFQIQLDAFKEQDLRSLHYLQGIDECVKSAIVDQYVDPAECVSIMIIENRYLKWDPETTKNMRIL